MEPTAQDVSSVAQHLGEQTPQPAPQVAQTTPQPAAPQPTPQEYTPGIATPAPAPQQQPDAPTPQPAPTQQPQPVSQPQDPFSTMFTPQSAQPEPTPQPQQPTEPQPAPQAPAPQPVEEPTYQTFEEYMNTVTQGIGEEPTAPDADNIDPNNPEEIKNFFDDLVNTAVQRAEMSVRRSNAIQTSERQLWDQAFDKYGSLRSNKELRDMVHSIRMGHFNRGIALTPTQAADKLLDTMKQNYQRGIADNTVVTTIEQVQPNGGGGQQIATTTNTDNVLKSVQDGGEVALAAYLDAQVKAGNL